MNTVFLHQRQTPFRRFLNMFPMDGEGVKMLKKILPFGCMCSAALASPILSEKQNIWFLDVLVFFASTAAYMLQHQAEIIMYGPVTFVAATILCLVAYSSARTSLKELKEVVPWVPFALCVFVLLTINFPNFRQPLIGDNARMEEGRSSIISGTPFQPGPAHSERAIQSRQQSLERMRWIEHNTSHMTGPASQHSGGQSTRDSDLDLNDMSSVARVVAQRMISPSRLGYSIGLPPQTFSDCDFPSHRCTVAVPSSQLTDFPTRAVSPDSMTVDGAPSSSADSEHPLMG